MSLRSSPAASIADTSAIGKPVAFEASAEDLDVRGFISITIILPVSVFLANCTLVPPMTWILSTILYAWRCNSSCTSSGIVSIGAEQNESPVCTPRGSMFSIKHTVIILPVASLTTSSSSSSQPSTDSSTRTCPTSEA